MHGATKKVGEDIAVRCQFNTAISAIMEAVNAVYDYLDSEAPNAAILHESAEYLLQLLAPFAPHITEELWHEMGHTESIHISHWPAYEEAALAQDSVEIVVQVNGKIRARLQVPANSSQEELAEIVRSQPQYAEWLAGKTVTKTIAIPGKLVNLVVK